MAFGLSKTDTGALSIRDQQMAALLAKLIGQQVQAALAEDRAARITK